MSRKQYKSLTLRYAVMGVVALYAIVSCAATFITGKVTTSGDPRIGGGTFYGYPSSAGGPGDDAFQKCVALAESSHRPMIWIYGKDSCAACSYFAEMVNTYQKIFSPILASHNLVNGYFRGNDAGSGPKACSDAYNFFADEKMQHIGRKGACHVIGCYGVFEDGVRFVKSSTLTCSSDAYSTRTSFANLIGGWRLEFDKLYDQHLYTPPKASVAFMGGTTEGTRLETLPGSGSSSCSEECVYVPFVRTNNLSVAETMAVEVNGTITNSLSFAEGEDYAECAVAIAGGKVGDTVSLVLLNTNMEAVATNHIAIVAEKKNSFAYPDLKGERESYVFGDWTLDLTCATNAVFAINAYDRTNTIYAALSSEFSQAVTCETVLPYTNATTQTEHVKGTIPVTNAVSQLCVTNVPLTEILALDFSNESMVAKTISKKIPVDMVVARAENRSFTTNVTVKTMEWEKISTTLAFPTNFTYTVAYTNQFLTPSLVTTDFAFAITNSFDCMYSNAVVTTESRKIAPVYTNFVFETVSTNIEAKTEEVFNLADSNNWQIVSVVGDIYTISYACNVEVAYTNMVPAETNFTYDVSYTNAVVDETATMTLSLTTNNIFTAAYSNITYTVETNALQHAGRDSAGFTLKVTGSPVWDARSIAFKEVFDDPAFKSWCISNKVATVLDETAEPGTGASLFSHNVASNKTSGTPFITSKGISVKGITMPTGAGLVIELMRPDGVIAGTLTPQFNKDGTCNVIENLKRLDEFIRCEKDCDLAADPTEPLNNAKETTPLAVTNNVQAGEVQSLQISDRHDLFKIEGLTPGTPFVVKVNYLSDQSSTLNQPGFAVVGDCQQLTTNVWVATDEQIQAGLYVDVTGWDAPEATTGTFGGNTVMYYTLSVETAPEDSGLIGFDGELSPTYEIGAKNSIQISVKRSGYTGKATAKISLDAEKTEVPGECFTWADTNVTWEANEADIKTLEVEFSSDKVLWATDVSNLVFTVTAQGADVDSARKELTVGISQEIDPEAKTGSVAITSPSTAEKIYVVANDTVEIKLTRFGARRETSVRDEARGEVVATLQTTFGAFEDTNTVTWAQYRTDEKLIRLKLGDLGTLASKEFKVAMTALDVDGKNIAVAGSNTVSFVVIPSDSVKFTGDLDRTVAQYVAVDAGVALESIPEGASVASIAKISGAVPAGLSYMADKVNGVIHVAGTPTKPGVYESQWWMRLRRADGTCMQSAPVTIRFTVKALGATTTEGEEALNPSFESARSWTGLPVIDAPSGHMVGTLDMTVAKTGRFSARYRRTDGKNVSFSKTVLDTVDVETGLATIEAAKTLSKVDYSIKADFAVDGGVEVCIQDPAYGNGLTAIVAQGSSPWSKANTAARWAGNYLAAFCLGEMTNEATLCTGPVTLRLKFDAESQWRNGKVTYQGYLPNGKSFSGSASFAPVVSGDSKTQLAIFFANASETFSALPTVDASHEMSIPESVLPYWQHREANREKACYQNDYAHLMAADKGAISVSNGRVEDVDGRVLTYSVNKTSGLVRGRYSNVLSGISSAAYYGVVLGEDLILGAYSYDVRLPGSKTSVKVGGALAIEK